MPWTLYNSFKTCKVLLASQHRSEVARFSIGQAVKKRIFITALLLAGLHLVLTMGCFILAYGSAMDAFDNPDHQSTDIERIAESLAPFLSQPAALLWTSSMSKNMPDIVEWVVYALNSLIWGIILSPLVNARARRKANAISLSSGME